MTDSSSPSLVEGKGDATSSQAYREVFELQMQVKMLQERLAIIEEQHAAQILEHSPLASISPELRMFTWSSLAGYRDLGLFLYVLLLPFRLTYKLFFVIRRWFRAAMTWLRDWKTNIPHLFWSIYYACCHARIVSHHRPVPLNGSHPEGVEDLQ